METSPSAAWLRRFDSIIRKPRRARHSFDIGRAYVELAAALGARFVRVFGDVLPPGPPAARAAALEPIAAGLDRLGEFAGTVQVRIVLETHGDFSDSTVVAALMPRIHSPFVGILWDTHHPWKFFDEPLSQTWDRLRPWVWHTHWKDSVSRPAVPAPNRRPPTNSPRPRRRHTP